MEDTYAAPSVLPMRSAPKVESRAGSTISTGPVGGTDMTVGRRIDSQGQTMSYRAESYWAAI